MGPLCVPERVVHLKVCKYTSTSFFIFYLQILFYEGGYPYPYPTSTDPARTIYIGKNNARHWADLKTRLGYNGDVDFVSFLLRLAEERLR